jgi:hypothetical protein
MSVKIYKNTTDKKVNVVGVGEIPPKSQVSISADQHFPVVLTNFPGVVELTEEQEGETNGKK